MHIAIAHKLVITVLLCAAAAAIICSSAVAASGGGDVETFSFPVFNATTTGSLIAVTNDSVVLVGANLLFQRDQAMAAINRSEGFLLLADRIGIWAPTGGVPGREASFNSTFALSAGLAPVAFVVLKDSYPSINSLDWFRGANSATSVAPDGSVSAAGPDESDDPAVGLNVTVTPNGAATASSRTVWVEYNATAHRLSVYVAAGGQARPARAALDAELNLAAGGRTTETVKVGFFAGRISDIVDGVSGWELTVDKLPGKSDGSRSKEMSWAVILVAVLVSVAVTTVAM